MDAVPVTLGQEFAGYAAQVRQGAAAYRVDLERVGQIPLGGTAVGTGLNTHPEFAATSAPALRRLRPDDPPAGRRVRGAGCARRPRRGLRRAEDGRRLADEDRQRSPLHGLRPARGLAEIFLPELQKGSSIMPGKVNPVIPEVVTQVAAQVIGNDAAIAIGGMQGHFELNCLRPADRPQPARLDQAARRRLASARREVRRRDRGEPRGKRALRRAHALGRDRAQPVHRLRQGGRDRQGAAASGRSLREVAREAGVEESVLDEALGLP
jgi:fumarate hydratase class II